MYSIHAKVIAKLWERESARHARTISCIYTRESHGDGATATVCAQTGNAGSGMKAGLVGTLALLCPRVFLSLSFCSLVSPPCCSWLNASSPRLFLLRLTDRIVSSTPLSSLFLTRPHLFALPCPDFPILLSLSLSLSLKLPLRLSFSGPRGGKSNSILVRSLRFLNSSLFLLVSRTLSSRTIYGIGIFLIFWRLNFFQLELIPLFRCVLSHILLLPQLFIRVPAFTVLHELPLPSLSCKLISFSRFFPESALSFICPIRGFAKSFSHLKLLL